MWSESRSNLFLIDQHLDRTKVSAKIPSIGIRLHQLCRRDLRVSLCRGRQPMPKPFLQLKQTHRFLGVEELSGDRRARPMTCNRATDVMLRYARFSTEP